MSDNDVVVRLNLASRMLIIRALNNPEKVTEDIPRKTRSIYRAFKLKEATEENDKLNEPFERAREKVIAHNESQRAIALKAAENNQTFTPEFKRDPGGMPWEELSETEEKDFMVHKDDLAWLKGTIEKYNWDRKKITDQMGKQIELIIQIDIGMQVAIADLEDSLLAAFQKKEPSGGEEKAD